MLVARLGIVVVLTACASCAELAPSKVASRAGYRIDNAETAVSLARLAWIEAHPELADRISGEAEWQAREQATLEHGVWTVWDPVPEGAVGGSVYILLAQADGHVIRMYIAQ
jgi:hypothetical protein